MACTGTYLGECCQPEIESDETIVAVVGVRGIPTFSRRFEGTERVQLYNESLFQASWDFSLDGVSYSGNRSESTVRLGPDHYSPFTGLTNGDQFPSNIAVFRYRVFEIEATFMQGDIEIRNPANLTYSKVGEMFYYLFDPLNLAGPQAASDASSYNPITGLWGDGFALGQAVTAGRMLRRVDRGSRAGDIAQMNIGTIAPVCGAFPPRTPPIEVFGARGGVEAVAASATRLILSPRANRQFKVVTTYAPECGFAQYTPPPYSECAAMEADFGLNLLVGGVPDGYQIATATVTEAADGTDPCATS